LEDLFRKARTALETGKIADGLAFANQAVDNHPKNAETYHFRGVIFESLQKHKEAVADFDKAIELDPKLADAYNRRGSEYLKLGKLEKSLADFDRFLELRPADYPDHWRRGIVLYWLGKYEEGRKQFGAYEKIDTNDVENAVWHYLCNAKVVGAEKARAAMLKIGNDKRVPMMVVYDLFAGKAKPEDVLAAVEKGKAQAMELKMREFYAHLYLGLYYESVADKKKTDEHMAKAAESKLGGYMGDVARVHLERLKANGGR
jgi:lipoprotein NlpI